MYVYIYIRTKLLCLFYLYVRAAKYISVGIQSVGEKSPFALTGPSRYPSMTLAAGCVRKESPLCRKFTSRGVHRCVVGGSSKDVFQTSKSCGLNHQIVLRHGFPPPCVSGVLVGGIKDYTVEIVHPCSSQNLEILSTTM